MPYAQKQLPKHCRHKASGRVFVRIGGKMYSLGRHGSEASRREYDRIITEYLANGRQALYGQDEVLVEKLIWRFLDQANNEWQYRQTTHRKFTLALRLLHELYGKTPISQFSPLALKAIRRRYIDAGLSRKTINSYPVLPGHSTLTNGERSRLPVTIPTVSKYLSVMVLSAWFLIWSIQAD
jgi:hypothetical protein